MAVQSTRTVVLSERMLEKLNKTEHFISKYLINLHKSKKTSNVKFSYIDMSDEDGTLSLLNSTKEVDFKTGVTLSDSEKWTTKNRTNVRIGSVVRALLKDGDVKFNDVDIENFSNKLRFKEKHKFELVKGNDIKKWYYHESYLKNTSKTVSSSLNASCMRYKNCGSYLSPYTKNPDVSLLICTDIESGKLLSRAIVWHKAEMDGKEIVFVDRIYTYDDRFLETVKAYINSKGWWSKRKQGRENISIENGENVVDKPLLRVKTSINSWSDKKPFMDTMRFLHEEIADDKITLYLANYEGVTNSNEWLQLWSCTDGQHHYNSRDNSTTGRISLLSKHLNVKMNDVIINKNLFIIKNKKYKFDDKLNIDKYLAENDNMLMNINFYNYMDIGSYIRKNIDIIYATYQKKMDKYIIDNVAYNGISNIREILLHLIEPISNSNLNTIINNVQSIGLRTNFKDSKENRKVNFVDYVMTCDNYIKGYILEKMKISKMDVSLVSIKPSLLKSLKVSCAINSLSINLKTLKEIYKTDDIKLIFSKIKMYIDIKSITSSSNFHLAFAKLFGIDVVTDRITSRRYFLEEVVEPKSKTVKPKTVKPTKKAAKKGL